MQSTDLAQGPVRLKEYRDWTGHLSDEDAEYVLVHLASRVSIRRRVADDLYVLNPKQYVGVVMLPSGRRLESHPKISVRNLFYMLSVAHDLPSPFRDELAKYTRLDEILEFVVSHFVDLVEERVERGRYRSYVEQEENLTAIRGRILFAEDARDNFILRHRTYCRYAEFSWDIPENQIVRQVVYLLGGWGLTISLRRRLNQLDATLFEETPTSLPISIFGSFQYNRMNEDYRQLHQFCQLFLEGASLSEKSGQYAFQTFLVDMNKLFEKFVTQVLRERAHGQTIVDDQAPTYLGHDKKVLMSPDIVVSKGDAPVLVADCKYKRLEPEEFKHHDMYQMLAYCTSTLVQKGLLIYPLHEAGPQGVVEIRNTQTVIQRITIDLGREGISELDHECDLLAHALLNSVPSHDT